MVNAYLNLWNEGSQPLCYGLRSASGVDEDQRGRVFHQQGCEPAECSDGTGRYRPFYREQLVLCRGRLAMDQQASRPRSGPNHRLGRVRHPFGYLVGVANSRRQTNSLDRVRAVVLYTLDAD